MDNEALKESEFKFGCAKILIPINIYIHVLWNVGLLYVSNMNINCYSIFFFPQTEHS